MKGNKPICHYCGESKTVNRHGTAQNGYPRFYCKSCKTTFQTSYIYKGYEENILRQIKRMSEDGYSPERISYELKIALTSVRQYMKHEIIAQ
ncbi:hypothetical protein HYN51_02370 [Limnobaculum parvum]|uniref:IS1 family transposase n=1 Tax=Limnobaculum parvum TaxID=2172103 RepID=A0A2Y9TUV7_9GAMM|nr:hypothetical protein HYN51_02370 [Limnobaculum parvum]